MHRPYFAIPLNRELISNYVSAERRVYCDGMEIFRSLPSTNTYLTELAQTVDTASARICFAESQTAGKGRLGRSWFSPFASNIYLSLLWHFADKKRWRELGGLSLAVAVAVIEALARYEIKDSVLVKWPNDILWQQRKLAGILLEGVGKNGVVIGVGLNVNMSVAIDVEIAQPWCDVAQITGTISDRNKLAGILLDQLLLTVQLYQSDGLASFSEKWCAKDATYGKRVTIITTGEAIDGIGRGIDEKGHFLLQDNHADGMIRSFAAGEVSLRLSHH